MAKDDGKIEMMGEVLELLPSAMFRVKLETGSIVPLRLSGKMRKSSIRVIIGDTVRVKVSEYGQNNGFIVYREK